MDILWKYSEGAFASGAGSSASSGKHVWQLSPSEMVAKLMISVWLLLEILIKAEVIMPYATLDQSSSVCIPCSYSFSCLSPYWFSHQLFQCQTHHWLPLFKIAAPIYAIQGICSVLCYFRAVTISSLIRVCNRWLDWNIETVMQWTVIRKTDDQRHAVQLLTTFDIFSWA